MEPTKRDIHLLNKRALALKRSGPLKKLQPWEIDSLRALWKEERKIRRPPWAVGASMIRANIAGMDENAKDRIKWSAEAKHIPFKEAVGKYLSAARWVEYQTAKEIKAKEQRIISETGNKLPYATFLTVIPDSLLVSASRLLSSNRFPRLNNLTFTERNTLLKYTLRRKIEYIRTNKRLCGGELHGLTAYDLEMLWVVGKIVDGWQVTEEELSVPVHEVFEFYQKLPKGEHVRGKETFEEKRITRKILEKLKKNPPKF